MKYSMPLILAAMVIMLPSCANKQERLCSEDKFFCQENWKDKVDRLSSYEIYQLDRRYNKVTGGGSSVLEDEFGTRGKDGIAAILDGSPDKYFDYHLMLSLLESIRVKSGIDACKEPYIGQVSTFLRNVVYRENVNQAGAQVSKFRSYCRS